MANYQPLTRRPIADAFRRTAQGAVCFCVRHNIHPDSVSYASVVAAAAAGSCFWWAQFIPALLIPAVGFCYVRLWFNMLDGMVALASGKASRHGEIVNELPDRISDVIIFVGAGYSGFCHPAAGYWAAIAALLVAYVGVLGQAVSGHREFGGWMSKPWRMVALHLGAWLTLGLFWLDRQKDFNGVSVLDLTLIVIIAGCVQTIAVRLVQVERRLRKKESGTKTVAK